MRNNILLTCAAVFSLVLLFLLKPSQEALEKKNSLRRPQEYMTNVFITTFTETGALKNKLSALYWAYLPEKEISTLTKPHLTVFKPDGSFWFIHAATGQIKQPNIGVIDQITLQQQVVLERPQTTASTAVKLETEELHYQPKKHYAESEKFVTLTKPGLKITGTGLRAFLDQSSVELLRDVKTYYTLTR